MGAVVCRVSCTKGGAALANFSPRRQDKRREIAVDMGELLIAEVTRRLTREVGLLSVCVFSFARPVVTGLRPSMSETVTVTTRDRHGDWMLSEVWLTSGNKKLKRLRLYMHAYSVVLPTPCVWVDMAIWKRLKESFQERFFQLTSMTLVLRTREFGFHIMTHGRLFRWDAEAQVFKVYNDYQAVYRHFGLKVLPDQTVKFVDLLKKAPFDGKQLGTSVVRSLAKPPRYDQNAQQLLRYALVEGKDYFALYDSTGEDGMNYPVFVDKLRYADDLQMILGFLEITHGRFTRIQRIVNGRHYPIHMESPSSVSFGLFHDFNYLYLYTMHSGTACRILHSNYGHVAVFGDRIVELDKRIVLRQVAYYG